MVPKVRFKGFTDEWEQQKLKTVVNRVTRKNVNNESNLPLTISAQDGLIAQDHFFGKKVASQNLQNYLLLKKGDFAYNKSYSNGYPFGSIKRLNKYKEGVISSLYIAFKPKQADSDYLEQFFDSDKWHREIYSRAAEGARNHGLLNISPNDFFDADVKLPSSNEEQKMIGDILKKVSEIITLQQHKLDQLNTLKKGLLQKMFADKKHPQPELRFKGFSGDWEQQKSEKIFKERKEKSDNKQLLSVSINNGVTLFDETGRKNNSSKDKHNYRLVLPGDIAYNSMRMWQGALGVSNLEGIVSPAYTVITPKQNEEAYFYYYMFKRKSSLDTFQRHSQGLTSDTWNLKFPLFKSIIFYTTNAKEQTRIASLLLKLDSVITHQQKQIDKLNSLKKSLLQNMFI